MPLIRQLLSSLLAVGMAAAPAAADAPNTLPARQDTTCHSRIPWQFLPQRVYGTPYQRPPELLNRDEVRQELAREWARVTSSPAGVAYVWLFLDECGQPRVVQLRRGSGNAGLDAAALRIAGRMRFSPADNGRFTVPVWICLPFAFGDAPAPPPPRAHAGDTLYVPARLRTDALLAFPAPEGYRGPSLLNEGPVRERLAESYEPFRHEGVRGTTVLALRLDADGRVLAASVAAASGYSELDEIALAVAKQMIFLPAVDRYRRYASVTTTVPIRFGR